MGASRSAIRRIFVLLGVYIAGIGILIGEGLAVGFAILQSRFGIIPLPRDTYYMDTAPVALDVVDFVVVAAVTLILCVLAAYAPARVASRTDPIRVIRFSR
jgi:lipoprotein-releasing system permease protein